MAHECPICGLSCHCGGDIDDLCFFDSKYAVHCTHCPDDEYDDEIPFTDDGRDRRG